MAWLWPLALSVLFSDVIVNASDKLCFGYEENCSDSQLFYPQGTCDNLAVGWAQSLESQNEMFYEFGDFGYVKKRIKEITNICQPVEDKDNGFLECTDHMRFCRGNNIYMDFRGLAKQTHPLRYTMDVLGPGDVGARVDDAKLRRISDHISPLQSWGPELRHFQRLENYTCDLTIETPIILMKIDAAVSYYHHFCDFLNLYISLHVNQTIGETKDAQVIIWETYPYSSMFSSAFLPFTDKPVWTLRKIMNKRICFKNVMFPLLPRMIYGLYYNTPLVPHCHASGLFKGFSDFIRNGLGLPSFEPADKIRVTLLSRRTQFRRILNEEEILRDLKENPSLSVKKVSFDREVPFLEQLKIIGNTDILIGMHGSGLTHLLFLPDWAVVFELYNCEDEGCYFDLARLRGIKYVTWKDKEKLFPQDEGKHPSTGKPHAKFTNYSFDVSEVYSIVDEAADWVMRHPSYGRKYSHLQKKDEL
ncbi:EGF domain-specific O-linked N-acetylglucosamine transferase-like isoform X2 [Artemia franciscana]|uniref:EGF domain-specific O-linked N-acetylglucosamine transferase-like isoform X2 n=1 Tax=Artemia franciscana TaxID=6661 RepID=UPI0032DB162C